MQEDVNLNRSHKLSECEKLEFADYLDVYGEQLYYVRHRTVKPPKACVLLLGPFVSERPHRYIPWVRWARSLAENGYDVLRFDYRGCGESSGRFEDFSFISWKEDSIECLRYINQVTPNVPVVLHGLGMGALIADQIFNDNMGNLLIMWHPPKSGRDMLYKQLRLRLANDFVLHPLQKKTRDEYISEIEDGLSVEVEGFLWTKKLWDDADKFLLSDPTITEMSDSKELRLRIVSQLDTYSSHMFGGVGPNPLRQPGSGRPLRLINPDLSSTFHDVISWLENSLLQIRTN